MTDLFLRANRADFANYRSRGHLSEFQDTLSNALQSSSLVFGQERFSTDTYRLGSLLHSGNVVTLPCDLPETTLSLLGRPEVKRLDAIRQVAVSYTARGQGMNHTRFGHSVDVMFHVNEIATRCKVPTEIREALMNAALLHDLRHPAFAHQGENIIRSAPHSPKFDHEHETEQYIQSSLGGLLGAQKGAVLALLNGKDPYGYLIKDMDRVSYLQLDFVSAPVSPEIKARTLDVTTRFKEALSYEPEFRTKGYSNPFFVTDIEAAQLFVALRQSLYAEFSTHPTALLFQEVLKDAVHHAVLQGKLSFDDLRNLTDEQVLDRLPKEKRALIDEKVDTSFVPVAAISLKELKSSKRDIVDSRNCQPGEARTLQGIPRSDMSEIERLVRARFHDLEQDRLHVVVTPAYEKCVTFPVLGRDRKMVNVEIAGTVSSRERYILIAAHRDVADSQAPRIRSEFAGLMRAHSLLRTPPTGNSMSNFIEKLEMQGAACLGNLERGFYQEPAVSNFD